MKSRPILFSAPMIRALLAGTKTQTRRIVKLPIEIAAEPDDAASAVERNDMTCLAWLPEHEGGPGFYGWMTEYPEEGSSPIRCPFGQPGDRLIVRETWRYLDWTEDGLPWVEYQADGATRLCERGICEEWSLKLMDIWADLSASQNVELDGRAADRRWRPSIHMPRWASRLTLEITGVRVERVQDITEEGAYREGISREWGDRPIKGREMELLQSDVPIDLCGGVMSPVEAFEALWFRINGPGSWDANPWVWVVEFKRIP